MTEPATADILAAWQLIEKHGLSVVCFHTAWACEADRDDRQYGDTRIDAVRAWAKVAEVEWPAVKTGKGWAALAGNRVRDLFTAQGDAIRYSSRNDCHVVPCDVVIRESDGE